jgi:competence protein ComEC
MKEIIKKHRRFSLLAILAILNLFIWYQIYCEDRGGNLKVAFLDVGQGDATFIESPSGNQVLIDGGPNKKILSELGHVMPFYDRSIDLLIATHPDSDHINGLVDIFKNYDVGAVLVSGNECETAVCSEFEKAIKEKNIKEIIARKGMVINMGDNVFVQVLYPDRDVSKADSNDGSIVTKIIYGNESFLVTGDSPKKIEQYLASVYGEKLKSNILRLGHHGSKTSTSENFLGFVAPEKAIISVGVNNHYGHPNKETLDLLAKFEIPIERTDQNGDIIFKTNRETTEEK